MRRIIYWLRSDNYERLIQEEDKWLAFIKNHELSTVNNYNSGTARYYNCKKFAMGGAWNKGQTGVQNYQSRQCEHCGRILANVEFVLETLKK